MYKLNNTLTIKRPSLTISQASEASNNGSFDKRRMSRSIAGSQLYLPSSIASSQLSIKPNHSSHHFFAPANALIQKRIQQSGFDPHSYQINMFQQRKHGQPKSVMKIEDQQPKTKVLLKPWRYRISNSGFYSINRNDSSEV